MTKVKINNETGPAVRAGAGDLGSGKRAAVPTSVLTPFLQSATQVVDALGRTLFIAKLRPSQRLRMFVALGDNSRNLSVVLQASIATSVVGIYDPKEAGQDGYQVAQFPPTTMPQLEASLDRLGDEGYEAAYAEWVRAGWLGGGEADEDAEERARRQEIKNS